MSAISHTSIIFTAILARVILKEKLGFGHLISLLFTVVGVIFIAKPSVIFPAQKSSEITNPELGPVVVDSNLFNLTENHTHHANQSLSFMDKVEDNKFMIGILSMLIGALLIGITQILVKKLCNSSVDWSVITIYVAYFGLPVTICSTTLFIHLGHAHSSLTSDQLKNEFPIQLAYAALSAVMANIGVASLNIAFQYEEATKVAILKTVDVLVSFLLQFFMLSIEFDTLSVIGSIAILLGTILVLVFKVLENKYAKMSTRRQVNCFGKFILFNF